MSVLRNCFKAHLMIQTIIYVMKIKQKSGINYGDYIFFKSIFISF